jgi:hypothetical protein
VAAIAVWPCKGIRVRRGAAIALLAVGAAAVQVGLQPRLEGLVFAEMLLEPWLILQGLVPYRDFSQQHAPLVSYLVAAVLAVAPQDAATVVALHVALVATLTVLVVGCGGRLGGVPLAAASGAAYVLLLPRLDGGLPWFEPFVAAALLLLVPLLGASGVPRSSRVAGAAGLAIGVGVLLKQTAGVALLVVLGCLLWAVLEGRLGRRAALARGAACLAGGAAPLLLAALWFAAQGALQPFFEQTVLYNFFYYARAAALAPTADDWPVVGVLVTVPLAALALSLASRPDRRQDPAALVPLLALSSLVTLLPRYAEFHYQQALPFAALSAGMLACWLPRARVARGAARRPTTVALAGVAAVGLVGVVVLGGSLLPRLLAPATPRQLEEPLNQAVVDWLAPRVAPHERLLVLGDTRLHRATNTLPATRHLYLFPWTYDGAAVRAEAEQARPRFAVVDTAAVDDPALWAYLTRRYHVVFAAGAEQVYERRAEAAR